MTELLSVADVGRRLGMHEGTIRGLIRAGKLPAVWVQTPGGRRRVRIRPEDVERLLLDPRLVECAVCEARLPWNAPECPRCGTPNPRVNRAAGGEG